MDPQGSHDRRIGGADSGRHRSGPPTVRAWLLWVALLFVVLLVVFFAVNYFGVVGDYRGDFVWSLVNAALRAALQSAFMVALSLLLWRSR